MQHSPDVLDVAVPFEMFVHMVTMMCFSCGQEDHFTQDKQCQVFGQTYGKCGGKCGGKCLFKISILNLYGAAPAIHKPQGTKNGGGKISSGSSSAGGPIRDVFVAPIMQFQRQI